MLKEGALQLRRRNVSAPADPGFMKVYCDIGGSLYTVDEYGTSAYIKGVANISSGIFGAQPVISISGTNVDISNCSLILNTNTDYSGTYNAYSTSGDSVTLEDIHDMQYLCVKDIAGDAKFYIESDWDNINGSNNSCVFMIWKDLVSSDWHTLYYGSTGSGLPNKILDSILHTSQLRVANTGTLKLTETATRVINVTQCDVYFGINKISVPAFISSHDAMFEMYHDGSSWQASGVSSYDNLYYNGPSGKALLPDNKYGVRWFYSMIDDYPEVTYTLGLSAYDSVSQAQMEDPPDTLPSYVYQRSLLVGRIIIGKGASSGMIEGAFGKFQFKPLTSDHNSLNGLQGGTYGQYYHLTSADYGGLTSGGYTNLHNHDITFTQVTPLTMWTVNHNLNRLVDVSIYNGNQKVEGSVAYSDYNTIILSFSRAMSGIAILT
jgi:hypothetical protein